MGNKILEKTLNNVDPGDTQVGYAAPAPTSFDGNGNPIYPPTQNVGAMSVTGSARAAMLLFAIIIGVGTWAWVSIPESAYGVALLGSLFAGLGLGLLTTFKPNVARISAPLYAIAEGILLGIISKIYEDAYKGIVVQAVLATGAIAFVMYTLYSTRIIKVTERFTRIVMGATFAIMIFYGLNFLLSMFNVNMPLINDTGLFGIIFSLVVIAIAASTLALDFDFIERGSQAGLPKYMNWAAAYGLVVSIIWIYLEVLRLLAKMRE